MFAVLLNNHPCALCFLGHRDDSFTGGDFNKKSKLIHIVVIIITIVILIACIFATKSARLTKNVTALFSGRTCPLPVSLHTTAA
ncbi:hypothetical protein DPMN_081553 [Dreissena polymorpha]|uniref:Uncharacterized protein n=1 Tax=Dreissena polymorpha TaxID=45954 RepID=A0A9D3Y982_DREPO|nr:hypothetical protein DPMN_081553 [Dreissena polymorpha]